MAISLADLLPLALLSRPMGGPTMPQPLPKAQNNATAGSTPSAPIPADNWPALMNALTQAGLAGPQNELHRAQAEEAKRRAAILSGLDLNNIYADASGAVPGSIAPPASSGNTLIPTPASISAPDMGGGMRAGGALTGDPLALIEKYESGGRNIMQSVVPPEGGYNPSVGRVTGPSTAQGYYQITNSTWRDTAPKAGVDLGTYPTAMSAPKEVQAKVARTLFDERGFAPWAPYNPRLAAAVARGEGGAPDQVLPTGVERTSTGGLTYQGRAPDAFLGGGGGTPAWATGPTTPISPETLRAIGAGRLPADILPATGGAAPAAGAPAFGSIAPPQMAQAGPTGGVPSAPAPQQIPQGAPVWGSLAPGIPAPGGRQLDPQKLAQLRAKLALGGISGDPLKGYTEMLYNSPEFQAQKHAATKDIDLRYAGPLAGAEEAARDPFLRGREQFKSDLDLRNKWASPTDLQKSLFAANINPASPEGQAIMRRAFPDTRPDAVRLAEAAGLQGGDQSRAIAGAIPGNAPTSVQKEMPVLLSGTPEEKAAYRDIKKLESPQTTINNVIDPIAKGVGESFTEQRTKAEAAVTTIGTIHRAREMLDQGIISGPGAEYRAYLARVGELFGVPSETAANTAAFKSAIGESILSLVKGLGTGQGITNADRIFAEKMAGGQEELGEKSIRQVLEIREKAERVRIKTYSTQAEKLLKDAPDSLKPVAPLLKVDEPPEYRPREAPPQGATPTGRTYQGKPVYQMPDGSMGTLQ